MSLCYVFFVVAFIVNFGTECVWFPCAASIFRCVESFSGKFEEFAVQEFSVCLCVFPLLRQFSLSCVLLIHHIRAVYTGDGWQSKYAPLIIQMKCDPLHQPAALLPTHQRARARSCVCMHDTTRLKQNTSTNHVHKQWVPATVKQSEWKEKKSSTPIEDNIKR